MLASQEITDRMALATGDSLGRLIRRKFTRNFRIAIGVLLAALIVANCLNLSADLMAIGQGMQLLHAGPAPLWSAVAGIGIAIAVMAGSFEMIGRIFKWLCLALLVYVLVLFVSHVNWANVGGGMLGLQFRVSPAYLGLIVGVLGTTVSPYIFFWQSAQRIEELRGEDLGDWSADADERVRERVERPRDDRVVRPGSALLAVQDACVDEHFQMVRDRRLAEPERLGEVADARLATGVRRDHRDEPQSRRIGDRLERPRELLGILGIERFTEQRRTARRHFGQREQFCNGHASIIPQTLTAVDVRGHTAISTHIDLWRRR
jgi:hypothetical protein